MTHKPTAPPPEPKLVVNASDLDLQLTELLGESHADFLILCFDGEPFEPFGTPFDTPLARQRTQRLVDALNDKSKDSRWPEFWKNWKVELCAQYNLPEELAADDERPVASYHISRVCPAYSKRLHVAIGLFETLADRIAAWTIRSSPDGTYTVEIKAHPSAAKYARAGTNLPETICLAIKQLLIDEPS